MRCCIRGRGRCGAGRIELFICIAAIGAGPADATVYNVGDGQPYGSVGSVPWEALQPGDTVLIHWRATPYREKWVLGRQGTAAAPIVVRGVPGPGGELPVIDGAGATTRPQLNYWSEGRGVIKIGGSNTPPDTMPRYITLESLDIRGARSGNTFTAADGLTQSYSANASAVYVEKGEHITIRGCVAHDCGNGLFVASSDDEPSRDILFEANDIYDNGNVGSAYEHNTYTAAIGMTYRYNRFGPPRSGSVGNALKDRSAGLVVRCNWIEGGNRQLDLVDAEDSVQLRNDPAYHTTFVYGNVLIEPAGAGNRQIVHYGGDSGNTPTYRKGTLHFYNNTIVSKRTDRTTLFRLSTNDETCDARNNLFYPVLAGNTLALVDEDGVLYLSHNWFKPGWVATFGTLAGTIHDDGTAIVGASPGFADEAAADYTLASGSACIDAGTSLDPAVLPANDLVCEYVPHQASRPRSTHGSAIDVGAFEFAPAAPDLDGDGDVDIADFSVFQGCFNGPGAPPPSPACDASDFDGDGDVDVTDFLAFQACFNGPGFPPACS